jgi:hypothetical protein
MVEFSGSNQSQSLDLSCNKAEVPQDQALPAEWRQLCHDGAFESVLDAPAAPYLAQIAVRELGLKLARETFRKFPIDRYVPDRDTLLTVAPEQQVFLKIIGCSRSAIGDALSAGEPLLVQSSIEITALEDLSFLPHGSFKEQLAWINAQVSSAKKYAFNPAELRLVLPVQAREGVVLKVPFESSITGNTPWAYAAHEAYQKVLSLAVAAAVLKNSLADPFRGDEALGVFLKHGLQTAQSNPFAILQEPLVKRVRALRELPRARLLEEMGERAALQAVQRDNYLKVFTNFINEQHVKSEKRLAKQNSLVALEEKLREQATMPGEIFDEMLADLLNALSANPAYRNGAPEDIASIALDLVKELIEVADLDARLDIACQWSRLIRGGMKKTQLPKRRK